MKSLRNILFSWPLAEVRAFFEDDLGVPLKVEATGKVFPVSDDAKEILAALLGALEDAGATLQAPARVVNVTRADGGFRVQLEDGPVVDASRLVLATGGLSLPKSGSDGVGLQMAASLGHALTPTYPALVPLTHGTRAWHALSGIAAPVRIDVTEGWACLERIHGDALVTHRGFSGPAVLDASRYVSAPGGDKRRLLVSWGRDVDWSGAFLAASGNTVGTLVRTVLPRRLADHLLSMARVEPGTPRSHLTRAARTALLDVLDRYPLPVTGNEGYKTAEVTSGGISLSEVSPRTLESRLVPGLHFAGEILDGTGRLGGYNFLWAWVTGRKAGLAIADATC